MSLLVRRPDLSCSRFSSRRIVSSISLSRCISSLLLSWSLMLRGHAVKTHHYKVGSLYLGKPTAATRTALSPFLLCVQYLCEPKQTVSVWDFLRMHTCWHLQLFPIPNSPYGLCGHKATLNLNPFQWLCIQMGSSTNPENWGYCCVQIHKPGMFSPQVIHSHANFSVQAVEAKKIYI